MAEMRGKTQLPGPEVTGPPVESDVEVFERGLHAGRELAGTAVRRLGAWAEEHPGQVVLAGLALGFVLGKLLLGRRRTVIEELE
jgi:hypothetical protein